MAHLTPEPPEVEGGERIERIFWTLSRFRTQGFGGPDPLQPGTIRDWCHLTGRSLDPDELRVVLEMDAAFLAAARREGAGDNDTVNGEG